MSVMLRDARIGMGGRKTKSCRRELWPRAEARSVRVTGRLRDRARRGSDRAALLSRGKSSSSIVPCHRPALGTPTSTSPPIAAAPRPAARPASGLPLMLTLIVR